MCQKTPSTVNLAFTHLRCSAWSPACRCRSPRPLPGPWCHGRSARAAKLEGAASQSSSLTPITCSDSSFGQPAWQQCECYWGGAGYEAGEASCNTGRTGPPSPPTSHHIPLVLTPEKRQPDFDLFYKLNQFQNYWFFVNSIYSKQGSCCSQSWWKSISIQLTQCTNNRWVAMKESFKESLKESL